MGERPTLILTTRLGVRPLGVRGDPLHAVAGQLLAVIRRRLGDGPANLLAEPQLRESGDGIDWYAAQTGDVRRFADLSATPSAPQTLATVDGHLAAIHGLGDQLAASQTSDEARLIGRSLQLSTRRPSDDFIYLVDGQPVIAAWGYEPDALASLQGFAPAVGAGGRAAPRRPPPARSRQRAGDRCRPRVRLVALLGRAAVRAAVPDPAADRLVAAARLRAGRSVAQCRHASRRRRRPRPSRRPIRRRC